MGHVTNGNPVAVQPTAKDPQCRARASHVCFDKFGAPLDREGERCFFETVLRLADKAHEIDEQLSDFAAQLTDYTPTTVS